MSDRRSMSSALSADRAEVLSDVPTGSLDVRTEELRRETAKTRIVEAILYERGWKHWNFAAILDCAINDGDLEQIAMSIKPVCESFGGACDEAVYEMRSFFEKLTAKHVSDDMIAQELADMESEDVGDELAFKERAA
jgi:hypothetical protein